MLSLGSLPPLEGSLRQARKAVEQEEGGHWIHRFLEVWSEHQNSRCMADRQFLLTSFISFQLLNRRGRQALFIYLFIYHNIFYKWRNIHEFIRSASQWTFIKHLFVHDTMTCGSHTQGKDAVLVFKSLKLSHIPYCFLKGRELI